MKLKTLATLCLSASLLLCVENAASAKTFDWPIDSPAARAASFTAYHGETVRFKLRFGGAMTNLHPVAIYYQTNGMGRAEWFTVPGTVFAPSNDCGAAAYRFFVRCLDPDGVDYSANGTLRMLDSPGFSPSAVQLPVRTIDFAHVVPFNAPWLDPSATNALAVSCALASRAATNYTDSATNSLAVTLRGEIANSTPGDYAAVSNAAMSAAQIITNMTTLAPIYTDTPTYGEWVYSDVSEGVTDIEKPIYEGVEGFWAVEFTYNGTVRRIFLHGASIDDTRLDFSDTEGGLNIHLTATRTRTDMAGYTLGDQTNAPIASLGAFASLTGRVDSALQPSATNTLDVTLRGEIAAATNSIVTTESDPVAMPAVQAVSNDVALLVAALNGETARFVVTNYNNVAEKAAAEVEAKINGEWQTVWRELTRWDWLIGEYLPTNYYTKAECDANFADRAWGAFDPTTGNLTPDGKLWLSAPSIYICAGASYERVANAAGEYWVLTANGMVADINGVSSNGFFRIADSDGVTQFEIVKGDRQTLAAVAGAMRSETVMGVLHYFTTYYVQGAAETPKATFARSLDATPSTPITWYEETDDACPFNVSWTNPESGTYVCEWWQKATEPKGFMKAEYVRGGETYIKNTAPVSVAGGILCTDGIHKVRPVYSNGSVTWEVVNP